MVDTRSYSWYYNWTNIRLVLETIKGEQTITVSSPFFI
jgi:hypothetical protein